MKKLLSILAFGTLPAVALAAGQHAGGHHDDAAAYGEPGKAAQANRVVEVRMADNMRYTPATVSVRRGETVKFVVKNTGRLEHEFVLGDAHSLKEHAEAMRRHPGMQHDDPNAARVAPGGTGELVWRFTRAGTVEFACLIPGHYEAGMKGRVRVSAK